MNQAHVFNYSVLFALRSISLWSDKEGMGLKEMQVWRKCRCDGVALPEKDVKQTLQDVDSLLDPREYRGDWCVKVKWMHHKQERIHCEVNRTQVLESLTCLAKLKHFNSYLLKPLTLFSILTFPSAEKQQWSCLTSLFLH